MTAKKIDFEKYLQCCYEYFQEDENKQKSHSPTPILEGDDEDMHDDDFDDMGNMSECEGDRTLSETKIRLDEDDEGYEEEEPGMLSYDCLLQGLLFVNFHATK